MSKVPTDLHYSKSHEWVRKDEHGNFVVGITDHAQSLLGDVVYVDLPEIETTLHEGDEFGVVESVKAAADVYSPISGEVIAVNERLADSPDLINSDPYGEGWLIKIAAEDESELDDLLDYEQYQEQIAEED